MGERCESRLQALSAGFSDTGHHRGPRTSSSRLAADEDPRTRFARGIERWNEGGLGDAEAMFHDDMVWEEAPLFPDSGTHRGRDAFVKRMQERLDMLGDVKLEVIDAEVRGELVLLEVIVRGEGAASGAPAEAREYFLWRLADDNRVLHWREFLRREDAEAALRDPDS
jgi:ketosteroid isomerase-like protein